jgi:hypothetical protein
MTEQKKTTAKAGRKRAAAKTLPAETVTAHAPQKAAARSAPKRKPRKPEAASLFDIAARPEPAAKAAKVAKAASVKAARAAEAVASAQNLAATGAGQAAETFERGQAATASFRHAVAETAAATTKGVLEVNAKVLEALRAQSDAALDLWRSALAAESFSEAVRVQTSGARQAYDSVAHHWKDVAETTNRWFGAAMRPIHSALLDRDS